MSLDYAILGFLSYRPFTGYELKQTFDNTVRHFWPADQSQIYRTLARLCRDGQVEVTVVPQADRPNRKVYALTETGRATLRDWLAADAAPLETRDGFLMQLFFAGRAADDEACALLETRANFLRTLLDAYERQADGEADSRFAALPARDRFFWSLTLDCGIELVRARLAWTQAAIGKVRSKAYKRGQDGALTHRRSE